MKRLFYYTLAITVLTITGLKAQAQDYRTGVGVKFGGYEIGPSVKYFLDQTTAVEGILGFRDKGAVVTGLYQLHVPIFNVDKLKLFYGGGLHLGAIDKGYYDDGRTYYGSRRAKFGFDGVIGVEYILPNTPISISVDLDPRLELATKAGFDIAPALGLKYTF